MMVHAEHKDMMVDLGQHTIIIYIYLVASY